MSQTPMQPTFRVVDKHPEQIRFPLMEQPAVGVLLALVAGLLNAWSLAATQTFATVQSGNVVSAGFYLVVGEWPRFAQAIVSVLFFGVGSALCGVLITTQWRRKRSFTALVLFILTGLLVLLAILAVTEATTPILVAWGISFVAGAQGNAFHKNHGMLYGAVAVTFVVQAAFNYLAQALFAKSGINDDPNLRWSGLFFLILSGFAAGGAVGVVVDLTFDGASIAAAAVVTLGIGIASVRAERAGRGRADPTPGGAFS
ncbi:DUF1275 family protein [Leifsonia aquatica]|uniref:DUF1275 family protein n=1 Tax=Leifsonia aquatica TaxID=144185 RepID=UPI00384A7C29